jgi:hypothetical protein
MVEQSGIDTLDKLRGHLQTALEVEHATIPPYFTAWLSSNEEANFEAARIVRSVMLEEMLHLALVANLLNAVGGRPNLTKEGFIPEYPHRLPHSERHFRVSLERLSPEAIETFLKIEQPEARHADPQPGEFTTIGQFYQAIADGIRYLCEKFGERQVFSGDPALQVRPEDYYGSGKLLVVEGRDSALRALAEIKAQGEGFNHTVFDRDCAIFGDGKEAAHYFRFKELQLGRHYLSGDTWRSGPSGPALTIDFASVYPIQPNTRISDYEPGSEIRCSLEQFCDAYHQVLVCLEDAFTGRTGRLVEATARMFDLKNHALALMRTPTGPNSGMTVGLAFTPQ